MYSLEWLKNANHDKKEIIYLDNEKQYKKIMESQGEKIDDLESWVNNKYLWFALGVLTTGLTVYLVK